MRQSLKQFFMLMFWSLIPFSLAPIEFLKKGAKSGSFTFSLLFIFNYRVLISFFTPSYHNIREDSYTV